MVGSLSGSTHFLHNGNSASSQDHHAMKKRKTSSDNCIGEIIFVWDRRDKMYAFTTSNLVDDIRCPFIFRFQFPPGLSACLSILCLSGTPQQLYMLMMSALECIPSWKLFFCLWCLVQRYLILIMLKIHPYGFLPFCFMVQSHVCSFL